MMRLSLALKDLTGFLHFELSHLKVILMFSPGAKVVFLILTVVWNSDLPMKLIPPTSPQIVLHISSLNLG